MSSAETKPHDPKAIRTVYRSDRRVVVSDGCHVAELTETGGWIRSNGTAGPMSGDLIATLVDGEWSPHLPAEVIRLVRHAGNLKA